MAVVHVILLSLVLKTVKVAIISFFLSKSGGVAPMAFMAPLCSRLLFLLVLIKFRLKFCLYL